MPRIAIVSPAILPGDAIGRDALHMGRILREHGHDVELFSTTWGKPQPRNDNDLHVRDFLADDPSAVLILHHAIGWPHAVPLIAEVEMPPRHQISQRHPRPLTTIPSTPSTPNFAVKAIVSCAS